MLRFKKMDDKKKRMVIIVSVLVVFIGISFAYVVAQISGSAIGNANITADTADNLDFSIDKDINLNPNQFNVTEGGGGLSDTATGTASLIANSTNNSATFDYYVYFQINTNEYIYTTEDNKPEIVLTITDPTGAQVTEVSGLTYVTVNNADGSEVSGFDITTASGLINIASNYEITSNSSTNATEQDWVFTVTFINLTTNQSENGGSTLDAEIILSSDVTSYHEICEPGTMACDIARLYNEENPETNGLYYHDGSIMSDTAYCMYEENIVLSFPDVAPSTSAEDCQNVYYGMGMYIDATLTTEGVELGQVEEVTWDSANSVCETTSGIPVYNDSETAVSQESCSGYAAIMNENESVIMVNVGSGTMENIVLDAEDYSYRYAGANPNNYVCFGSDEATCPNDNLYRIIGIFGDQVKLIKSTSIGDYAWDSGNSNTWDASTKSDIYTTLNVTYYNTLESEWQNKIANVTWEVGGVTWNRTYIAKDYYDLEVGSGQTGYVETMKIGLMYASDYGYAADPSCWTKSLSSNGYGLDNWLYLSNYAWLISPSSSSDSYGSAYNTGSSFGEGGLSTSYVVSTDAVYPTFYLLSSITLSSGTGTESAPYRIA